MSIQPGPGYTFTSSSLGTNLNIEQPWSEWNGGAGVCPLQIYNLRYDSTAEVYYINVSPGMVNNLGVTDHDDNPLTDLPPPDIQVFEDGLDETTTTNYVYVVCQPAGAPDYTYPDPDLPPYITIKTDLQTDDDETAFFLIGIVQGSTDTETDIDTLHTFNYKGCGSLWSQRFKCGSGGANYWWSGV